MPWTTQTNVTAVDWRHSRTRSVGIFLSILGCYLFVALAVSRGKRWRLTSSSRTTQTNVPPANCSYGWARPVGDVFLIPSWMGNFGALLLAFVAGGLGNCPRRNEKRKRQCSDCYRAHAGPSKASPNTTVGWYSVRCDVTTSNQKGGRSA